MTLPANPYKPVSPNVLISRLNWRYATQKFDPARKIPADQWDALEQALVLTPSSYGLQPWRFAVVQDPSIREQLMAASWGQRQLVDASHVVVFAMMSPVSAEHVQRYIDRIVEVRGVSLESLEKFKQTLLSAVSRGTDDWHARQAYIAMGNFMTAAAMMGIDTCPMEGLNAARYDQILGFDKQGLKTVAACPAGYRADDDKYAVTPKVRFRVEEVIVRI